MSASPRQGSPEQREPGGIIFADTCSVLRGSNGDVARAAACPLS